MTLILKRTEIARDFITGGQETVGLRVPNDPIALALIEEFETISESAIAAPSANKFGQVSPTSSFDVQEELGDYLSNFDIILDGGDSNIGIESTIIDCTGVHPIILRSGYITKEAIGIELGDINIQVAKPAGRKFSGSFEKHYAPKCKIFVGKYRIEGAGFLAMSEFETPIGMFRVNSPGTIRDFASLLYSSFRITDRLGIDILVVQPPTGEGLAVAIRERLNKASKGR